MADVFISYSRKDQEFVRDLHEALAARQRDTWVDWEDIPKTAAFLAEIHAGIDAADSFVFVISPAAAKSKICRHELAHAVGQGKRIIPVVRVEVDRKKLPEPLPSVNWLFFRETDGFKEAFEELLETLDTDLDWVRAHSRLLVRTVEWNANGRDPSFLLRGTDIQRAVAWISESGRMKSPRPTALQADYIQVSQQAETEELQRVRELYQNALARQLAAEAEVLLAQQPALLECSLLLAVEATRRSRALEATEALRHTLELFPLTIAILRHDEEVSAVAISPDGRWIATGGGDGTAHVWRADDGALVWILRHERPVQAVAFSADSGFVATGSLDGTAAAWRTSNGERVAETCHGDMVKCVAISPDGKFLASGGFDQAVRITEIPGGGLVRAFDFGSDVSSVVFSTDGKVLAACGLDGVSKLWSMPAGDLLVRIEHVPDENTAASPVLKIGARDAAVAAFSPDGCYLATGTSVDNSVRIWEIASGAEIIRFPHDDAIYGVAFTTCGSFLATASCDGNARVWNLRNGREQLRLRHEDKVQKALVSPDNRLVVTASADRTGRVWDATGRELLRLPHANVLWDLAISPDATRIVTASADGTARLWSVAPALEVARIRQPGRIKDIRFSPDGARIAVNGEIPELRIYATGDGQPVSQCVYGGDVILDTVCFSPEGKLLAIAAWDNTARLWDAATGQELARLNHDGWVRDVAFSPDGQYLATASEDRTARIWRVGDGEEVSRTLTAEVVWHAAFSPDGKFLATGGRGGVVQLWDDWRTAEPRSRARLDHGTEYVSGLTFSPDSALLATRVGGRVRIWFTATGEVAGIFEHESDVHEIAFSPDGSRLAAGCSGGVIVVWDLVSQSEAVRLQHQADVFPLVFSRGGDFLASGSQDRTCRVWEIPGGRERVRIKAADDVMSVAFSPDDRLLAFGCYDGNVVLRLWRGEDLLAVAEQRLTRNLTSGEWQRYLGSEPYGKTVPSLP